MSSSETAMSCRISAPILPDRRGQVKHASRAPASFDGAFKSIVGCPCFLRSMRIYLQVRSTHVTEVRGTVVAELPLSIYVNGERLVTLLCSPFQVDTLVVGHLWMERVIGGIDDIVRIDVSEVDGRATSSSEVPGPCVATYGPMA